MSQQHIDLFPHIYRFAFKKQNLHLTGNCTEVCKLDLSSCHFLIFNLVDLFYATFVTEGNGVTVKLNY